MHDVRLAARASPPTGDQGAYIVTAGTYRKQHLFAAPNARLLTIGCWPGASHGWRLQAWAVFSNHYHFVALSPATPRRCATHQHLHSETARELNE